MTAAQELAAAKRFVRAPYAWPGGYPLVAITSDGATLCHACIRAEWRQVCAESLQDTNCGFRIRAIDVNWEDTSLTCDHCSGIMPSAYGDV